MTSVAHGSGAVSGSEVEALRRRLLALRGDIDEILTRLAHSPGPGAPLQPHGVGEPSEACAMAAAPQAVETEAMNSDIGSLDDLTLIAGIDSALAGRLDSLGIVAFSQIAHWSSRDVARVSEGLGLGRRVCKENWIEQAAMLASGRMTAFADRGVDRHGASIWHGRDDLEPSRTDGSLGCEASPCDGEEPTVAEAAPASRKAPPSGPVLDLEPYRGIPTLPRVFRKASFRSMGGGVALAVKVAACLAALVMAGLVMVDRDAWGSVPSRRKAPLGLQAQVRGSPADGAHVPSKSLFEMEGLTPEVR